MPLNPRQTNKQKLWSVREPDKAPGSRKTHREVVDKSMNDLHLKPSDAVERSKWRELKQQE